jgi:hypothetical protein
MIEAEATGDDDEPAAHVFDGVEVGAREAHECFLHHVFGEAEVTEHAERDVEEMVALAA